MTTGISAESEYNSHTNMLISTDRELAAFCESIRNYDIIAIDTEFIREESYLPRLETIQLKAGDHIGIVDFPVMRTLDPLWETLYDDSIEKVFHAAQQDLTLFYLASGRPMNRVFDTQIAAAMVGYGEQIGYGQLVKQVTGVALSKSQSYTAWGIRPLSPAQVEYALDDVRYLGPVAEHLKSRLTALGRENWALEEFRSLQNGAVTPPPPANTLYLRVRGADTLDRRELAILRELTASREVEAQRRNRLPQRLLRDELLVSLSRRPPQNLGELKRMRGFPPNEIQRQGDWILVAAAKGKSAPESDWPEKAKPRGIDTQSQSLLALMQAFIRARAVEKEIAWTLLATSSELEEIATRRGEVRQGDTPALSGWRYDLVGHDLLALIQGELRLGVDAASGRVQVII